MNDQNDIDLEPEEPRPDDLAYQQHNVDLYLDERYRQVAEIIDLYLRFAPPMTRYNQVIGSLADEANILARQLGYETVEHMSARISAEIESDAAPALDSFEDVLADDHPPPADLTTRPIGVDTPDIDPPFGWQ